MRDDSKRVTIHDVAQRAGVSIGTVSRVLNHGDGLDATRRTVLAAVKELGYVPNHMARSLKRQSSEQIALLVPDIANPVYTHMAKAVQRVAYDRGYRLSLTSGHIGQFEASFVLDSLEMRRVDGAILCSIKFDAALLARAETLHDRICIIGQIPDDVTLDSVRPDSTSGALQAVRHLIEGGRSVIGFVNGPSGTVPADARSAGYHQALDDHGITPDDGLIVETEFTMAGGYRAADQLLGHRPDLDAVFCANDVLALGVLRRFRERGISVPHDVALVGMDDIELGRISTPTLSTVSLLADERGRIAATRLLDRLQGHDGAFDHRRVTVTPQLIIRESSTDYVHVESRA